MGKQLNVMPTIPTEPAGVGGSSSSDRGIRVMRNTTNVMAVREAVMFRIL